MTILASYMKTAAPGAMLRLIADGQGGYVIEGWTAGVRFIHEYAGSNHRHAEALIERFAGNLGATKVDGPQMPDGPPTCATPAAAPMPRTATRGSDRG